MINGLNYNTFEQLNGLHIIYADEVKIDKVDQKEINTLDNINTTITIQEQINNLSSTSISSYVHKNQPLNITQALSKIVSPDDSTALYIGDNNFYDSTEHGLVTITSN